MSHEITRDYLRKRMALVLAAFIVTLAVGVGAILFMMEQEKIKVKFGAALGTMADVTSNLLYNSAALEHVSHLLTMREKSSMPSMQQGAAEADENGRMETARLRERFAAAKSNLRMDLRRLNALYEALEQAAAGDAATGEGESLLARTSGNSIFDPTAIRSSYGALLAGHEMPEAMRPMWFGSNDGLSLKRDIAVVILAANQIELDQDLSDPAALQRFRQLRDLAGERVKPALAMTLDELNSDMIASYSGLQRILVIAGIMIALSSLAFATLVFLPMIRNITEAHEELRKANRRFEVARDRAESSDRAKSEFLANMSHEIRTPMNGVLGMAELLAKTDLDTRQQTFTEVIVKSGNALLTIINDILDFSKIDAGQLALDPGPFKLSEAVEDVATLVSAKVAEKDLELIVRVDPQLPRYFVGDVGRIRQILTNLLSNAVKFTDTGHVLVDVARAEGEAVAGSDGHVTLNFRVEDTGLGIPEDRLSSIFEKFAQVDSSSTRRHEGTGLGLAIASRLVELMDGEMSTESEVGKGSVFQFSISLPVHESESPEQTPPVDVSGARILVVDDNAINRDILTEQLMSWNFDCHACDSGADGLARLMQSLEGEKSFECVVLDYQMPGMNGEEFARIMHGEPELASIPIIILTSVDQLDAARLAGVTNVVARLTKPARSSVLLEAIVRTLQRNHATKPVLTEPNSDGDGSTPGVPAGDDAEDAAVAETVPVEPEVRPPEEAGSLDILVAEDNDVNQLVFSQILDGSGLSYHIVGNGELAVQALKELQPRLVLMDISMPVMNGFEATRAIRSAEKEESLPYTPIIGVTAHALKGDRERCMEAGMDDYLPKPISPDRLMEKINRWMTGKAKSATG